MVKTCNNCQAQFNWKEPYDGTKLNLDGSVHQCAKKSFSGRSSSYKIPMEKSSEILNMSIGFADSVVDKMINDEKFKGTLDVNQFPMLVTSFFKTLSTSYKVEE